MIPFRLAFTNEEVSIFNEVDLVFDIIFMLDIAVNFNTSIYLKGSYFILIILGSLV